MHLPRLYAQTDAVTLICGDVIESLGWLDDESVQMCVTSPPYYGLRDYGVAGQMGLEPTPDEYIASMVRVFAEVKRVLRPDGTLWLNIGDSYAGSGKGPSNSLSSDAAHMSKQTTSHGSLTSVVSGKTWPGVKAKDLIGIPWMLAFALRADGWYLRSDIIWHKPNPMPESVTDRPTKAHEYLFLLAKSREYFYDMDATRIPVVNPTPVRKDQPRDWQGTPLLQANRGGRTQEPKKLGAMGTNEGGKNMRTVWSITPRPYKGAHFATFPTALVEPCIKAGSFVGSTVLDPFAGSGTVGEVATAFGRKSVLVDLNPAYCQLACDRLGIQSLEVECSKPAA